MGAILDLQPSVETAEEMNLRMAEYAERFRLQQAVPTAVTERTILLATVDGTSGPMRRADRAAHPAGQAAARKGLTRRTYVGAVYWIQPFVRDPQEVLGELLRQRAAARRPCAQDKRVWAEMAARPEGSWPSGSEAVFIEMAIDVEARDPDRQQTLVCLRDGERQLWDLPEGWLGRSVEVLDFFYVLERVRAVSKVVHPRDDSVREGWVGQQVPDMLTGKVETVVRRWRRPARGAEAKQRWTKDGRETVSSAIG